MKKEQYTVILQSLLFGFIVATSALHPLIVKLPTMNDLEQHLQPIEPNQNVLLWFDVDHTIIFNVPYPELPTPCEECIPQIIEKIKKIEGISLMCITKRMPELAIITTTQLQQVNIFIEFKLLPNNIDLELPDRQIIYRDGILYSGNHHKYVALLRFLEYMRSLGIIFTKIIGVDDLVTNLEKIEAISIENNIDFLGLHYTKTAGH